MKNSNCIKTNDNGCVNKTTSSGKRRSVSSTSKSSQSNWTKLSKKVLQENMGAWKTLAKE